MKFIVTFSRGSGQCYDEEVRYFEALDFDTVKISSKEYRDKYLSGWSYIGFSDIGENLDEFNSEFVSARFG